MGFSDEENPQDQAYGTTKKTFTTDEALDELGFGWFQWKVLILCGVVWAADAMEIMLLSFLLPEVAKEWNLNSWVEATVGSVVFLGMMLGAYLWGMFSDRFGRKWGYLATSVFSGAFGVISAFSPNVWVFLVTRTIVGFGLGGSPVAFSLFSEFLPRTNRGAPLILIETFWTIGTLGEAGLAWFILPRYGWRVLLIVSSLPLILVVLFYPILPETPRYYLVRGDQAKAHQVLENVAKANRKTLPEGELMVPPLTQTGKLSDLLAPEFRTTSALLWIIWFANSFAYYGLILFTPEYFKFSGDNDSDQTSYLEIFVTTAAEFPGLIFSALLIDRVGRKNTQSGFFLLCGIFTMLLILQINQWVGLTFAVVARLSIMAAFCTTYAYTPEVYPTSVRTTGLGIANSMAKLAGILTPYVATAFFRIAEWIPISIYAFVCVVAAVAALLLPVETNKRGLQDVVESRAKKWETTSLIHANNEERLNGHTIVGLDDDKIKKEKLVDLDE